MAVKSLSRFVYHFKIKIIVLICDVLHYVIGFQQDIINQCNSSSDGKIKVVEPLSSSKSNSMMDYEPINEMKLMLETPAVKLSEKIKSGEITSEQLTRMMVERCRQVQPLINALAVERFQKAIEDAESLDARLMEAKRLAKDRGDQTELDKIVHHMPLFGIPVTVKESIAVKDFPQTLGMIRMRHIRAISNSEVVDCLIQNGMIVLATTNLPELSLWWADCQNNIYGRTLNPYDFSRVPGGSSGGEGSIIGSGATLVGVGTDIGGSVRIPAHFCGIFGHKTSPNIISNRGLKPMLSNTQANMFSIGPMCRYAEDLKPMLLSMTHPKFHSMLRLHEDASKLLQNIDCIYFSHEIDNLTVGNTNQEIRERLHQVVDYLTMKLGSRKQNLNLYNFRHCLALWTCSVKDGQLAALEEDFFGESKRIRSGDGTYHHNVLAELLKWVRGRSEYTIFGLMVLYLNGLTPSKESKSYYDSLKIAQRLRDQFNSALGPNGIFIFPTHPTTCPKHYQGLTKASNCSYASIFNVLQVPATHVTLGLDRNGLPFGVQIVALKNNDALTISVAEELARYFGGWRPPYGRPMSKARS